MRGVSSWTAPLGLSKVMYPYRAGRNVASRFVALRSDSQRSWDLAR